MIFHLMVNGKPCRVRTTATGYEFALPEGPWSPVELTVAPLADGAASLLLADGTSLVARLDAGPEGHAVLLGGQRFRFAEHDPRSLKERRGAADAHAGPTTLASPMPGRIVKILLAVGSEVNAKQGVLMVEAMKMQNELKSPKAGVVEAVLVAEGDSVAAGQPLAIIR